MNSAEPTASLPPTAVGSDSEKGSRKMLIALILSSVVLAGMAQVTLKSGVNHVTDSTGGALQLNSSSLKALFSSGLVWAGLALFGISAIVWLFALSRASLSFAYPFAALGYVIIVLFSIFVLHEHVPPLRWAGVALIVAGIVLVAQTPHV